ncbi:hypothetical protein BGZ49_008924 [Haplosporangium sp. Z 27]|nr:hypothetical protein BGZ49_008924 [Haplosporangium sp. Z 27]
MPQKSRSPDEQAGKYKNARLAKRGLDSPNNVIIIDDKSDDKPNSDTELVTEAQRLVISFPSSKYPNSKPKRRLIVSDTEDEEDNDDEELQRVLADSKADYESRLKILERLSKEMATTDLPKETLPKSHAVFAQKINPLDIGDGDQQQQQQQQRELNGSPDSGTSSQSTTRRSSGRIAKSASNSSNSTTQPNSGYYVVNDNHLDEAGNILIVGEDESPLDEGEEETLPVRILDDFTVYNLLKPNSKGGFKIAGLECYYIEGYDLRASGKVRPEPVNDNEGGDQGIGEDYDESDNGLEEEEQFINISTIFYVQLTVDPITKDDVVWIRTQFAFYRLEQPSAMYAACFTKTMKQGLIAHDDDDDDEDMEEVEEEDEYDNDVSNYIDSDSPMETNSRSTSRNGRTKGKRSTEPKKTPQSKSRISATNRKAAADPCVTRLIASLAGDLFNRQLKVASHEMDAAAQALLADEHKLSTVVKDFTHNAVWDGNSIDSDEDRTYYSTARVDGVKLAVGDCVYVRNDSDEPWLAKIMYFFEQDRTKYYHIRYFARGSETILMETAGTREIFLLDNCIDAELVTAMGKCPVTFIGGKEDIPSKDYYYRFWYDFENLWSFEDATKHENLTSADLDLCKKNEPCISCARSTQKSNNKTPPVITKNGPDSIPSFRYHKQEYHERDFVYLVNCYDASGTMTPVPNCTDINPYNIGQIRKVHSIQKGNRAELVIEVQLFERYDNFLEHNPPITSRGNRIQKPIFKDHRRLVLTNKIQKFTIDSLEGVCRVKFIPEIDDHDLEAQKALSEYKDQADCFYYKDYLVPASKFSDCPNADDTPRSGVFKPTKVGPALSRNRGIKMGTLGEAFPVGKRRLARISDCGTVIVNDETTVVQRPRPCRICEEEWWTKSDKQQEFLTDVKKLRALDIFSGCGGLSLGLKESGVVETRYSIEFMTSAAQTYRHNFPGAKVYNDDANVLLSRAIDRINGKTVPPRNDFAGQPLSDMPYPEDVDMIYCGPPCQGFSRLNMFQKSDDLKNSLIATAMSYVDIYRPQYFLLENVRGMLSFRLGKVKINNKWEGGIQMGVVKFVVRCLTAMGYQCRFGLLQAGHHNLPQSRRRLFIWGAKFGSNLPEFPKPSTCFPFNEGLKINPLPGLAAHNPISYQRTRATQAPDPVVTVRDAIGDLPGFEYINPHIQYQELEEEKKERLQEERWAFREARRLRRRKMKQLERMAEKYGVEFNESDVDGYFSNTDESEEEKERVEEMKAIAKESGGKVTMIPGRPYFLQVDGKTNVSGVGYSSHGDQANGDSDDDEGGLRGRYSSRPQSEYQRRMRARAGKVVMNHVVRTFNDMNLERICRVAMWPEADHRSLPELLKPWCLSSPDSAASRNKGWAGLFGRLDFEGQFQTAVTEMQPMGKQGKVVHPNQSRVLSVRESARVQGFPDDFEFLSTTNEVKWLYMQIGNAVPPPLARALGTKLREAMMLNSESKGKEKWH